MCREVRYYGISKYQIQISYLMYQIFFYRFSERGQWYFDIPRYFYLKYTCIKLNCLLLWSGLKFWCLIILSKCHGNLKIWNGISNLRGLEGEHLALEWFDILISQAIIKISNKILKSQMPWGRIFSSRVDWYFDISCYYSTAFSRVQITPKTSTNIPRYLYSTRPVWQVFYKCHVRH